MTPKQAIQRKMFLASIPYALHFVVVAALIKLPLTKPSLIPLLSPAAWLVWIRFWTVVPALVSGIYIWYCLNLMRCPGCAKFDRRLFKRERCAHCGAA